MQFERSLVVTRRQFDDLLEQMASASLQGHAMGLDTESSGPNVVHKKGKKSFINMYRSTTTGMSLAFQDGHSFYIPFSHIQPDANLPLAWLSRLEDALCDFQGPVLVHNLKHELLAFSRGPRPFDRLLEKLRDAAFFKRRTNWFCTQVGCWLGGIKSDHEKKPFGLKLLAKDKLGILMSEFTTVVGKGTFDQLTPKEGMDYACEDAEAALLLFPLIDARLSEWSLWDWYLDVEMPTVWMLRDMTDNGMAIDETAHVRTMDFLQGKQDILAKRWAFETDHSIGSPAQLQHLFSEGIWPRAGIPTTPTGNFQVNKDSFPAIRERCKPGSLGLLLLDIKEEYQQLKTLTGTFGMTLLEKAWQYPDGRLHGDFNQTGTATGRFSSSYPNLQNIPKRTELGKKIRESFVAPGGNMLVTADYSQIELRVLAHLAGKGSLYDGYHRGIDVHQDTADAISAMVGFEVVRDQGKTGNFAVVYGAGPKKVSSSLGLTLQTGKRFLEAHAKLHVATYDILDRIKAAGRERGYVKTLAGRRRVIESAHWGAVADQLRADGHRYKTSEKFRDAWYRQGREDRRAGNTPIQGGAADVVKLGMLRAWRTMPGKMVCQIHDDIMFEVEETLTAGDSPKEYGLPLASETLKTALEGAYELRVPLIAEPSTGRAWSDL